MTSYRTMWNHIRRYPYQALAAILLVSQTFFMISLVAFVIYGSSQIISYFESRPQVIAFFNEQATQANIDALKSEVASTGKVASVKIVSKQEALQIYRQQNKDDPLLLELVTADELPASLEISTHRIEDLAVIADVLKKSPFVREVDFQKDLVKTLTQWTNALRKIGVGLIIAFGVDAVVIIVIILGIKISQKKTEIEIMRLVGATSWYIRRPFILEGIFYGVIGAIIGWMGSIIVLLYARPSLLSFFGSIPLPFTSPVVLLQLLAAELVLAVALGILVSFMAVLRYLK